MGPLYEPVESPDETTVFPYHSLTPPTTADIYDARTVVSEYLPQTPLVYCEWLSSELDADVYLKREDVLPTGAFKIRGGLTLLSELDEQFKQPGVIAASTGNHGKSIAYAGRKFDVPVVICVSEDANREKIKSMEQHGAEVRQHGDSFDEAREHAERLAAREGYRYVHSANEPALIRGVGTAGLEIVEELPSVDVLFSPVGAGSGAAGYCLSVGELADADVIGVQSADAPAMYHAWKDGDLQPHNRMETFAEGVATQVPFALTTDILRNRLDDFLLVDDGEIRQSLQRMLTEAHVLMEGACATSVAAAFQCRERVAGKTVVIPVTGRNLSVDKLRELVAAV
jgi:threonine dehydratase